MCSLLAKRICSHFFSPSPLLLPHHYHIALLSPLLQQHLSTHPSSKPKPQKEMPFIAEYLISSLSFSPDRALKLSVKSNIAGIKSPDRPDAVIKFLRNIGLSDSQIKSTISVYPAFLASNVDKTLKPNWHELVENVFSEKVLVQLIRYSPHVLLMKNTLSKLLFWRDLVGNDNEVLFKIIPRVGWMIGRDVDSCIVPRINILKEYGLSNGDIVDLLLSGSRCMNQELDSLRQTIELIEELGIARTSSKFLSSLKAVGSFSKDKIQKKVELYKTTYGWSEEDVHSAFKKFPYMLEYSEEKIRSNMEFLIKEAKFEPRSLTSHPRLIGFSLQKRLVPRHHVLSILAAKELKVKCSLSSVCYYTEERFLEKFVEPYKKDVPEIASAYSASYGRELRSIR